jgi:hypothetical protein
MRVPDDEFNYFLRNQVSGSIRSARLARHLSEDPVPGLPGPRKAMGSCPLEQYGEGER